MHLEFWITYCTRINDICSIFYVFALQESWQPCRWLNGDERRQGTEQPPHKRQKQPRRGKLRAGEDVPHPLRHGRHACRLNWSHWSSSVERQTMVWSSHQWQGLSPVLAAPDTDLRQQVTSLQQTVEGLVGVVQQLATQVANQRAVSPIDATPSMSTGAVVEFTVTPVFLPRSSAASTFYWSLIQNRDIDVKHASE